MRTTQTLDFVGGALYGTVPAQSLQSVIQNSAERLSALNGCPEPLEIAALVQGAPRALQVAAFFALLNYDTELKDHFADLGPARAAGFYRGLRERAVPRWLENEARTTLDLITDIRTEYRNA